MRTCPGCREAIPREAAFCPYCTWPIPQDMPNRILILGVVIGAIVGVILVLVGSALLSYRPLNWTLDVEVTEVVEVTRLVVLPVSPTPLPTATSLPVPRLGENAGATRLASADGMTQLFVPAGPFLLGAAENDALAKQREQPQYIAFLSAYWIDQLEVTNRQFRQCVEANGCPIPAGCPLEAVDYADPARANFPIVCVSWAEAEAYCQWAGRRLPTEAEWEKAARGPDGWRYPWGVAEPDCQRANYDPGGGACTPQTAVAGLYGRGVSPYGVLDMAGNAAEWTADWFDENQYALALFNNPQGPETGQFKVVRGGSWSSTAAEIRTTARFGLTPETAIDQLGFRCAQSAREG
jgi:formylglycine-generating enzyme required for sulfatase activity